MALRASDAKVAECDRAVIQSVVSEASLCGEKKMVQYALEQGANVNSSAHDKDGNTPLHDAARNGHLDVALLLMVYGADVNVRNKMGQLPIEVATKEEIKQAIQRNHGCKRGYKNCSAFK